jgi:hypothetical protein
MSSKKAPIKAATHKPSSKSKIHLIGDKAITPNLASVHKSIVVDTLVIGSGPAALGFLVNSLKTGRLNDLIRSKDSGIGSNNGIAIISEDISFGGGQLGEYGINSNTSASGFLKCISRV